MRDRSKIEDGRLKIGDGENEAPTPSSYLPTPTLILREVADAEDIETCMRTARAAGHSCAAPTHIIEDGRLKMEDGVKPEDGKLRTPNSQLPTPDCVGYASIGAVTVLTGWLHDDKVSQAEARQIIEQLCAIARDEHGRSFVIMPCTHDCRMLDDMKAMGFRELPKYKLFFKRLNS